MTGVGDKGNTGKDGMKGMKGKNYITTTFTGRLNTPNRIYIKQQFECSCFQHCKLWLSRFFENNCSTYAQKYTY